MRFFFSIKNIIPNTINVPKNDFVIILNTQNKKEDCDHLLYKLIKQPSLTLY